MNIYFAVHAIVATPGRILDLMNKNLVKCSKCGILVLDEVRCFFIASKFYSQVHKAVQFCCWMQVLTFPVLIKRFLK